MISVSPRGREKSAGSERQRPASTANRLVTSTSPTTIAISPSPGPGSGSTRTSSVKPGSTQRSSGRLVSTVRNPGSTSARATGAIHASPTTTTSTLARRGPASTRPGARSPGAEVSALRSVASSIRSSTPPVSPPVLRAFMSRSPCARPVAHRRPPLARPPGRNRAPVSRPPAEALAGRVARGHAVHTAVERSGRTRAARAAPAVPALAGGGAGDEPVLSAIDGLHATRAVGPGPAVDAPTARAVEGAVPGASVLGHAGRSSRAVGARPAPEAPTALAVELAVARAPVEPSLHPLRAVRPRPAPEATAPGAVELAATGARGSRLRARLPRGPLARAAGHAGRFALDRPPVGLERSGTGAAARDHEGEAREHGHRSSATAGDEPARRHRLVRHRLRGRRGRSPRRAGAGCGRCCGGRRPGPLPRGRPRPPRCGPRGPRTRSPRR